MPEKIPKHAKKVFSWIRSDVYQWDQEMYDGSMKTFERITFTRWSFVIPILPDKSILITTQDQPERERFTWLPGWAFDREDEDPLECVKREFLEETGYMSDDWELWFIHEGTSNVISSTYFYVARDCRRVADTRLDPGERITLSTCSFDEFLLLSEDTQFVHWPLLPYLFMARLHPEVYTEIEGLFWL